MISPTGDFRVLRRSAGALLFSLLLLVIADSGLALGKEAFDIPRGSNVRRGHLVRSESQFPFVVLLVGRSSICSGSLVSPSAVLSAGHCACGKDRLNHVMVNTLSIDNPNQVVGVTTRLVHPGYSTACRQMLRFGSSNIGVGDSDMSIFRLRFALTSRTPASFAQLDFNARVSVGTTVIVAGFGRDDYEAYRRPSGLLKWGRMQTTQCIARGRYGPICVPYESYQNAAPGDSGGPLMRPKSKEIVGTVSGAITYTNYEEVLFAPVQPNADFIRKRM